jgi:hypothetical protein
MPNQVDIRLRASGQGQSAAAVAEVARSLEQLQSAAGFASSAAAAFAGRLAYEGVAALRQFGAEGLRSAEQMKHAAERTGMSAKGYQQLAYAARLTGSSMGAVDVAMRTLQVNIAENDKALSGLGLNLQQIATLAPDEQFRRVAEAIARIPGQADRTRAAMQAFGRSGQELLPMIGSLRSLAEEAERLGVVLDEKALAAAERFNESIEKLKLQAQSKIVVAVEYVQTGLSGEDPTARRELQGMALGAVGGAVIGARLGGPTGAKYGAVIGAAVTRWGQKQAEDLLWRRYSDVGRERDEADARAAEVERERADAEAREAARLATPNLDMAVAGEKPETEAVAAYLEKLRKDALVARDAGLDAAEALRRAWAAATGEDQVSEFPAVRQQATEALGRFRGAGGLATGFPDWQRGAETQKRRAEVEAKAEAEALEKRKHVGEQIAETEKSLAAAEQQAADAATRQEIAAERARLRERLQAVAESARARMQQARDLAGQEQAARARLLAPEPTGEERREQRESERQERRLERRIAGARGREEDMLGQGLTQEQARGRMTRRGRELLEYDDLRTQAQEAQGQAQGLAAQEQTERAATDARLAELQAQELALGQTQVDATTELTAELARLRAELAALGGEPPAAAPAGAGGAGAPAAVAAAAGDSGGAGALTVAAGDGEAAAEAAARTPRRPGFSPAELGRGTLFGSAGRRAGDRSGGRLGRHRIGSLDDGRIGLADTGGGGRSRRGSRMRDGGVVAELAGGGPARGAAGGEASTEMAALLPELKRHGALLEKLTQMTGVS